MSRLTKIKNFLSYTWFMWSALVGSVLMFRYVIMLPFLNLVGMEPLFHTGTEMLVSSVIAIYWLVPGLESVKNKFSPKNEE